jgi:hypothetical protein
MVVQRCADCEHEIFGRIIWAVWIRTTYYLRQVFQDRYLTLKEHTVGLSTHWVKQNIPRDRWFSHMGPLIPKKKSVESVFSLIGSWRKLVRKFPNLCAYVHQGELSQTLVASWSTTTYIKYVTPAVDRGISHHMQAMRFFNWRRRIIYALIPPDSAALYRLLPQIKLELGLGEMSRVSDILWEPIYRRLSADQIFETRSTTLQEPNPRVLLHPRATHDLGSQNQRLVQVCTNGTGPRSRSDQTATIRFIFPARLFFCRIILN